MIPSMDILKGICVDYLGFLANLFPFGRSSEENRVVENRGMEDILSPEFTDETPKGRFLGCLWWRYRRRKHNAWKHRLVYPESLPVEDVLLPITDQTFAYDAFLIERGQVTVTTLSDKQEICLLSAGGSLWPMGPCQTPLPLCLPGTLVRHHQSL